jgi:hypothetical protein
MISKRFVDRKITIAVMLQGEIPPQFVTTRNREVCTSLSGFQEVMMHVFYKLKRGGCSVTYNTF